MNFDLSCVFEGLGSHGALYISNSKTATNFFLLEKLNIKAIITATKGKKIDLTNSKIQKYLYLEIEDYEDFNVQKYFEEAFSFIENARKVSNVLVHCNLGDSTSVTIVMAYLIRKYSYSVPQVYTILKLKRKQISLNAGFIEQLENYSQMYSVRNTEFPKPKPKYKHKIQRSVSFETPTKTQTFDLTDNCRQIKSQQLKEKIKRLANSRELFNEDQEKIEQLHKQRQFIEERLRSLRQGLLKIGGVERKKRFVEGEENQNPNIRIKVQESQLTPKQRISSRLECKNKKLLNFSSLKEQFAKQKEEQFFIKQK